MFEVLIVSTGVANIASVQAGFARIGAETRLSDDPAEVSTAHHVMLPGVGAFGAGMSRLRHLHLDAAIKQRVAENRPTMAICLGLQLLGESSEETPGIEGLGILRGHVREFSTAVRVPHFGWNEVVPSENSRFLERGFAYFANSFRYEACQPSEDLEGRHWSTATTAYDGDFIAAIELGQLLACQFHPELSGPWGLSLMQRWLEGTC